MSLILNGTDGLSDVDGSAATPAIRGTDANTGIFFPAADTIAFSEGGVEAARFDASGNLGVGTSSPAAATGFTTDRKVIQVANSGYGQVRLGAASGTMIDHDDSGNTTTTIRSLYGATSASAKMQLQSGFITFGTGTSYTEVMRILSSSAVLIGCTTNPNSTVAGKEINQTYYQSSCGATTTTATHFYFTNGNGNVGTITTNGSSTAYNTSSDYRLKENIAPMVGALTRVTQLKPVIYTWKIDGSSGEGFIAHELQSVVPDCVTGEKDAVDAEGNPQYQGIDNSFLVATLTAAIQELNAKVDAQAVRIAELEGAK